MVYVPDQGDIIWVDFDPSKGKEIMKRRPAFVISRKEFNKYVGLAIVSPITSTIRGIKLEVVLSDKLETVGSILVYQLKSLDFSNRNAKFIEKAPKNITNAVLAIANVIMQ